MRVEQSVDVLLDEEIFSGRCQHPNRATIILKTIVSSTLFFSPASAAVDFIALDFLDGELSIKIILRRVRQVLGLRTVGPSGISRPFCAFVSLSTAICPVALPSFTATDRFLRISRRVVQISLEYDRASSGKPAFPDASRSRRKPSGKTILGVQRGLRRPRDITVV